jgi:HSCB C-terminal oligomerisation domain
LICERFVEHLPDHHHHHRHHLLLVVFAPKCLMQMMERQEQVVNVDLADDDNDTTENGGNAEGVGAVQLHELWRQAVSAMDKTGRRLQQAVDDNDLDTAHRCIGALHYWTHGNLHELVPRR